MFTNIIAKIQAYMTNEEGATAIEYGLIAAGISVAIVAVVFTFGDNPRDIFAGIGDELGTAADRLESADDGEGG